MTGNALNQSEYMIMCPVVSSLMSLMDVIYFLHVNRQPDEENF